MKIFNNPNIAKVLEIYGKTNRKTTEKVSNAELPKDQLELSGAAKEFQIAMKAYKDLPEVREEKVNELKEKIQQGRYNISGKEIAEKIIEGIQIDKKI
ncbi:flagellar biosynthesis anti-sigma factor FlgM [Alkaliphilus serpentinus]|uniref:Negative regulator of flagellin synthesis n=1 Tax=Alkaliphilus serpentinus TaxID=1482731 RepID=A0A833MCU6_9FIRM|nr:flagellar biosynthesis anti-sigma factor FlgM [Alkaliphilus serpentinus]KAB3526649.1 flagellar biosynthesis anti-sigma factor FlgM [Alkaliphilus serpentinus]